MLRWNDVKHLHLEISAVCNAVCPGCRRYPANGYDTLPFLDNNIQWSLDQVKQFFPADSIGNITNILFNGNHGDFIAAKDAVGILDYFLTNCPNAFADIHTNGSARNKQWWENFGKVFGKRGVVSFALDGLEDTHKLYRRETDWNRIIDNAKTFMAAGGRAVWQMIIFEHNQHQVDECRRLSKELGFERFTARYNSRGPILALDKNMEPSHWIRDAKDSYAHNKIHTNIYGEYIVGVPESKIADSHKKRIIAIQDNTFKAPQYFTNNSLSGFDKEQCTSLGGSSIFVSAGWVVSPCCHVSGELEIGNPSRFYDDLISIMAENNLTKADLIASENLSVPDILNRGNLDWVLNRVESNAIRLCHRRCNFKYGYKMQFKRIS